MNIGEIKLIIEQRGYRYANIDYYNSGKWSYLKRCNSAVYCNCNDKPVNFEINFYELNGVFNKCDIRIVAETNCGDWVDFAFYSIDIETLFDDLTDFEYRLQRAWESVN